MALAGRTKRVKTQREDEETLLIYGGPGKTMKTARGLHDLSILNFAAITLKLKDIGAWVVDIFSLNENIKFSPKLAIIQRQNTYLQTCTLLTLWHPNSWKCVYTLELGRHNVNKVHVCKYLSCRWIIASLGENLMFSLREKISTTQAPMLKETGTKDLIFHNQWLMLPFQVTPRVMSFWHRFSYSEMEKILV